MTAPLPLATAVAVLAARPLALGASVARGAALVARRCGLAAVGAVARLLPRVVRPVAASAATRTRRRCRPIGRGGLGPRVRILAAGRVRLLRCVRPARGFCLARGLRLTRGISLSRGLGAARCVGLSGAAAPRAFDHRDEVALALTRQALEAHLLRQCLELGQSHRRQRGTLGRGGSGVRRGHKDPFWARGRGGVFRLASSRCPGSGLGVPGWPRGPSAPAQWPGTDLSSEGDPREGRTARCGGSLYVTRRSAAPTETDPRRTDL